ncbi:MAG TPA: TetR family transcriptional regulator [Caulobacterales bacterium]|nr:TetR family transcriptional regulator [Caulobacterales bacterium]
MTRAHPRGPSARPAPVSRLRDAAATQRAILAAARAHFARAGYEGALLRDIAADAGVDAALINRYFGGKDGLFEAVIEDALHPDSLVQSDRAKIADRAAAALAAGPNAGRLEAFSLILHAATSRHGVKLLDKVAQARFMGPIRDWLGGADAAARARLLTAVIVGAMVERMVRDGPVPAAEQAAFKARLARMLRELIER